MPVGSRANSGPPSGGVTALRILHVNKFLYRKGGAEGYMEDVAALQEKAGHEVAFWGMAHPENTHTGLADTFAVRGGLRVPAVRGASGSAHVVRTDAVVDARPARGIERAVERFQPDVAHLHNIYHQLSPSILGSAGQAGRPDRD